MARHEKALDLIRLVLALRGSTVGLSLDEIASRFGVGRRTAERMRDAVRALYPELDETLLSDGVKRFRLPGCDYDLLRIGAEELSALDKAAEYAAQTSHDAHAQSLNDLADKVRCLIDTPGRRRIEPDVELLAAAEGFAMRPGPRPIVSDSVSGVLREAVLGSRSVLLDYLRSRTREPEQPLVHPYGFLYGNRSYLVAHDVERDRTRLFPLDGIEEVWLLDEWFERPASFDLREFATRSFGVYQEEPHAVVWRFRPEVAEAAKGWLFHPSQELTSESDGSLTLRFRAGGLQEMAFHAFTWGGDVEILAPKELRELVREMAEDVAAVHAGDCAGSRS